MGVGFKSMIAVVVAGLFILGFGFSILLDELGLLLLSLLLTDLLLLVPGKICTLYIEADICLLLKVGWIFTSKIPQNRLYSVYFLYLLILFNWRLLIILFRFCYDWRHVLILSRILCSYSFFYIFHLFIMQFGPGPNGIVLLIFHFVL